MIASDENVHGMTNQQLADYLDRWEDKLRASKGEAWCVHIPAQTDDVDVVMCEAVRRLRVLSDIGISHVGEAKNYKTGDVIPIVRIDMVHELQREELDKMCKGQRMIDRWMKDPNSPWYQEPDGTSEVNTDLTVDRIHKAHEVQEIQNWLAGSWGFSQGKDSRAVDKPITASELLIQRDIAVKLKKYIDGLQQIVDDINKEMKR